MLDAVDAFSFICVVVVVDGPNSFSSHSKKHMRSLSIFCKKFHSIIAQKTSYASGSKLYDIDVGLVPFILILIFSFIGFKRDAEVLVALYILYDTV